MQVMHLVGASSSRLKATLVGVGTLVLLCQESFEQDDAKNLRGDEFLHIYLLLLIEKEQSHSCYLGQPR